MAVLVTGIGLVTALGARQATWKRILAGESGIQLHQPFPALTTQPLGLVGEHPASLEALTQQIVLEALQDAGLTLPLGDCGIVLGSSRGNQGRWEDWAHRRVEQSKLTNGQGDFSSRPFPWLETLPHAAAITAARLIGTGVAVRSPMAACATGIWAIAQGCELIRSGACERVIAGAVEAPITPLTLTGFAQMGALAKTGAYPFDRDREGLVLAEGGAVLVLESSQLAQQRNARVYGEILGWGLTADGYHVSAPEPNSHAAIAAVRHCLQRSRLWPEAIGYIHAHGTATRLNDQNEAQLIQALFPSVPTSSTKGSTGHTIGASGALGVALSLLALRHQLLPPNVGLTHPAFPLDFVLSARSSLLRHALCLSFGFGGQNAAIALKAFTQFTGVE